MSQRVEAGATHQLAWAAATSTGRRRDANEDAFGVNAERGLFVVADGCGGVASGRGAADIAVRSLLDATTPTATHADTFAAQMLHANRAIYAASAADASVTGMGCTVVALRWTAAGVAIAHVGDCRAGRLTQPFVQRSGNDTPEVQWLTTDHNLWWEAQRAGASPNMVEEIRRDHSTVVTRVVGVAKQVEVDVQYRSIHRDDLLLLCSDGLWRQLELEAIGAILRRHAIDLVTRCSLLLGACEDAGGHDNATVVLIQQLEGPSRHGFRTASTR